MHEVHRSFSGAGPIGTALVLGEAQGHKEVWGDRIEFVTFTDGGFDDKARDLEIFLDVLSAVCTPIGGHLIDPRYDSQLDDAERRARDAVQRFIDSEWGVIADTSIGRDVDALVTRRGGRRPSER